MLKNDLIKIIEEGGSTINKNGELVNFLSGYQVSKKDCYKIPVKNVSNILKAVKKLQKRINNNDFIGFWTFNGYMYIDISEHFNDLKTAVKFGREKKQISIFDWQKKDCLYLQY